MTTIIDSLLAFFSGADVLLSLLLSGLIFSLFLNLAQAQKNTRSKKQNNLSPVDDFGVVRHYLVDQSIKTKNKKISTLVKLDNSVIRLRVAYLAIEEKALNKGVDSDHYWGFINAGVNKLFELFFVNKANVALVAINEKIKKVKSELKNAPNEKSRVAVEKSLDNLYEACVQSHADPDRLEGYNRKLDTLMEKLKSVDFHCAAQMSGATKSYVDRSKQAIVHLNRNSAPREPRFSQALRKKTGGSIEHIVKNSRELRESIGFVEGQIDKAKMNVDGVKIDLLDESGNAKLGNLNRELNDISDEILAENDREIKRMRGIISDQKTKIRDLEVAIRGIEQAASQMEDGEVVTKEIANLKSELFEAEKCIEVLESELDSLRTNRDINRELQESGDVSEISDAAIEELKHNILRLEADVIKHKDQNSKKDVLLTFARESLEVNAVEDLALQILECFGDLGLDSQMLIKSPSRMLELSAAGPVPQREKNILTNMRVNEFSPTSDKKRLYFRRVNIGGVCGRRDKQPLNAEDQEYLTALVELADKVISKVTVAQKSWKHKKAIETLSNSIKVLASDMDSLVDGIVVTAEGSIKDSFQQAQDVGRAGGMTAKHISGLKTLEKGVLEDLHFEANKKLRIKKTFLALLKRCEEIDEQ